MKIAIVDDDISMCEQLTAYLSELLCGSAELVCFPNGEDFLHSWRQGDADLIILDIFMKTLTGIDVAREIRKTDKIVKLVFSTASNEFASESYEVNACYYLRKPLDRERVKAMLDRINITEIEKIRTAKLPDGSSVRLRDILYADCAAHCVTLHNKCGENTVVRTPFSEIEALLCAYPYFLSPTKGTVINLYEAELQNCDAFKMSDGSFISVSRRKAKEVLEAYSSFRFDLLRQRGES